MCALLQLVLMLLLLLLRVLDLGVCKSDAEGVSVGADGDPTEGGGEMVGQLAQREDAGLADVEVLA